MPQSDIIYNWNNLRKTDNGERYVASQTAINHKANGFNADETLDLMVADNFDVDLSRDVLSEVFGSKTVQASARRLAMVVPTSYKDVAPIIDEALSKLSPSQFVDSVFNKLILSSKRDREGWKRLANQAILDPVANKILHEDLKPWVEERMLNSVLVAEKEQARVASIDVAAKKYQVISGNTVAEVNLADMTKIYIVVILNAIWNYLKKLLILIP